MNEVYGPISAEKRQWKGQVVIINITYDVSFETIFT